MMKTKYFLYGGRLLEKTHLSRTLLTSTALLAGALFATGKAKTVAAASTVRINYSSNLRQAPSTSAKIIGGLNVGATYTYTATATANGYTWYQIGTNEWVASAGASATTSATTTSAASGKVQIKYASNQRSGAGTSYSINGSLKVGAIYSYTATKTANGYTWYQIGTNKWVASAGAAVYTGSTAATTSTTTATTAASGKVQIKYTSNQRSGAGTSYSVNGSLKVGAIYSYTATKVANGYTWYQIGTNKWVASAGAVVYTGSTATTSTASTTTTSTTATTSTASAKIAAVIALAKTEIGKPYVWGGKGPNSFDCSGLMYYVFLHAAGINIGGYTGAQQSAGTKVSLSALKPGDILFWSSNGTPYHDALYIGNDQYIAAPKPGENVKIASISNYFEPSFAVRVLQ